MDVDNGKMWFIDHNNQEWLSVNKMVNHKSESNKNDMAYLWPYPADRFSFNPNEGFMLSWVKGIQE